MKSRRILSLLCAAVTALGTLPVVVSAADSELLWHYDFESDGAYNYVWNGSKYYHDVTVADGRIKLVCYVDQGRKTISAAGPAREKALCFDTTYLTNKKDCYANFYNLPASELGAAWCFSYDVKFDTLSDDTAVSLAQCGVIEKNRPVTYILKGNKIYQHYDGDDTSKEVFTVETGKWYRFSFQFSTVDVNGHGTCQLYVNGVAVGDAQRIKKYGGDDDTTASFRIQCRNNGTEQPKTKFYVDNVTLTSTSAPEFVPAGLSAISPATPGQNGKITGVNSLMEYSADKNFPTNSITVCPDGDLSLKPGTYYVRYKTNVTNAPYATVVVKDFVAVESVTLPESYMLGRDGSAVLPATILPADASDTALVWTSSNESAVTVDQSGKITAVEYGTSVITATAKNGVSDTCTVTVSKAAAPAAPVLSAVAPSRAGMADGKIIGVTPAMEYAVTPDFATPIPCTGNEILGLTAGTYYVRLAATATTLAGLAATVEIPEGEQVVIPMFTRLRFDTCGGSEVKQIWAAPGYTVDLSKYTSEREGYTFGGWYLDAAYTQAATSAFKLGGVPKTLYAMWIPDAPVNPYTDVAEGDAYYDAVLYVTEKNLMGQTEAGKFDPAGALNRADLVSILWNMAGRPSVTASLFADVDATHEAADAILWATANGIINGYDDGTFRPTETLSREMMATIVYRYLQSKGEGFVGTWMFLLPYTDLADISDWAYEAVAYLTMKETLDAGEKFFPQQTSYRADLAMLLYRLGAVGTEDAKKAPYIYSEVWGYDFDGDTEYKRTWDASAGCHTAGAADGEMQLFFVENGGRFTLAPKTADGDTALCFDTTEITNATRTYVNFLDGSTVEKLGQQFYVSYDVKYDTLNKDSGFFLAALNGALQYPNGYQVVGNEIFMMKEWNKTGDALFTLETGKWYNICLVYDLDGATIQLLIDGEKIGDAYVIPKVLDTADGSYRIQLVTSTKTKFYLDNLSVGTAKNAN